MRNLLLHAVRRRNSTEGCPILAAFTTIDPPTRWFCGKGGSHRCRYQCFWMAQRPSTPLRAGLSAPQSDAIGGSYQGPASAVLTRTIFLCHSEHSRREGEEPAVPSNDGATPPRVPILARHGCGVPHVPPLLRDVGFHRRAALGICGCPILAAFTTIEPRPQWFRGKGGCHRCRLQCLWVVQRPSTPLRAGLSAPQSDAIGDSYQGTASAVLTPTIFSVIPNRPERPVRNLLSADTTSEGGSRGIPLLAKNARNGAPGCLIGPAQRAQVTRGHLLPRLPSSAPPRFLQARRDKVPTM